VCDVAPRAASDAMLEVIWRPTNLRLVRRFSFRLIGIRNIRKGRASKSFACCLKQRMRSSIVSKAKQTATSASFGKTSSPDNANRSLEDYARSRRTLVTGNRLNLPGRYFAAPATLTTFAANAAL